MKKVIFIFTMFTLLLVMVACGGTSTTSDSTSGTGSTADNSTALSEEMQLLIGTFKLEDTDLAVSSEQAGQLLLLWQALQSLGTSDTAASEEIDAVINQIKATMTSQQMDAITAMKLTQQDVMTVMSDAGLSFNDSSASDSSSSSSGSSQNGFPAGGFDPGAAGGPPSNEGGGGPVIVEGSPGGMGGGQQLEPGQIATLKAGGIQSGGTTIQIPTSLLNALIELLQEKI
jgi:uncharacterized membrane protein YgcG